MGEFDFIAAWRTRLLAHAPNASLPLGPGDDAAVCSTSPRTLVAADMLMDGVHFQLAKIDPALVGRKALAVNLSDVAAMGGRPTAALVSLALPRHGGQALGDAVMRGLVALAAEHDVAIAGGDTNSWDGPLVIAVTILGEPPKGGAITRGGAKVGDAVLVTGAFGGSIGGRHLTFSPRLAAGQLLAARHRPTAMLDVSDGLAADLKHILDASGVGAVLDPGEIPRHAGATLAQAMRDGEDFELCFTMPAAESDALIAAQPCAPEAHITRIGTIVAAPGLTWTDGTVIDSRGFSHQLD